jgi:hypothetical protein
MVLMNLYNNALLARHPLLRPLVNNAALTRPAVRIWADASGKGYGAHLGPAEQPIATFQHERLTTLPSPDGETPLKLQADHVHVHEAVALYLSLDHFRPFLRGATVVAYTDNMLVAAAFRKIRPRGTKEDLLAVVDAVKRLSDAHDIDLDVKLVEGKHNVLADALSRFASSDSPKYPAIIKSLRENHVEGSETAIKLIGKIVAAGMVHKYTQEEEIAVSIPPNTPDQAPSMETVTGDTSSWEAVEEVASLTGMTALVSPMSTIIDVEEKSNEDGSTELTELQPETPSDDFNELVLAMEKSKAAKAKKVRGRGRAIKAAKVKAVKPVVKKVRASKKAKEVKEEAVLTPSKDVEASPKDVPTKESKATKTTKMSSDTSGLALIEAAENLIKQAQELVKAAKKLVKAAGKKK